MRRVFPEVVLFAWFLLGLCNVIFTSEESFSRTTLVAAVLLPLAILTAFFDVMPLMACRVEHYGYMLLAMAWWGSSDADDSSSSSSFTALRKTSAPYADRRVLLAWQLGYMALMFFAGL